MESVQRIVLATSRPESIGEPKEVFLVNGLEKMLSGRCEPSAFGRWVHLVGCAQ
jgi:hypothetical protein